MVKLHCPCCKQLIEVNPDKGGTIVVSSCLGSEEAPPTAPKSRPGSLGEISPDHDWSRTTTGLESLKG